MDEEGVVAGRDFDERELRRKAARRALLCSGAGFALLGFVVQDAPSRGLDSRVLSWIHKDRILGNKIWHVGGRSIFSLSGAIYIA